MALFPLGGCASDMVARPDGTSRTLVTVAPRYASDGRAHVVVVALTAGGHIDGSYGRGGRANVVDDATGSAFTELPGGKLLVVGHDGWADVGDEVVSARLTTAGALDGSFGDAGIARTDAFDGQETAHDLAVQGDGRVVVVATVPDQGDGNGTDVGVYRFVVD